VAATMWHKLKSNQTNLLLFGYPYHTGCNSMNIEEFENAFVAQKTENLTKKKLDFA
jgi:hypothetical protein